MALRSQKAAQIFYALSHVKQQGYIMFYNTIKAKPTPITAQVLGACGS